jgi:hypothetical protein
MLLKPAVCCLSCKPRTRNAVSRRNPTPAAFERKLVGNTLRYTYGRMLVLQVWGAPPRAPGGNALPHHVSWGWWQCGQPVSNQGALLQS